MEPVKQEVNWGALSEYEKKKMLFEKQKATLDKFLSTGAISKQQYDTSLNGLITKMGIKTE